MRADLILSWRLIDAFCLSPVGARGAAANGRSTALGILFVILAHDNMVTQV